MTTEHDTAIDCIACGSAITFRYSLDADSEHTIITRCGDARCPYGNAIVQPDTDRPNPDVDRQIVRDALGQ